MKLCNGICLTASDIGLWGSDVAYAHPTCPKHGSNPDHEFEYAETDGYGHEYCKCGGVRESHREEYQCLHIRVNNSYCFDCGFHD